MGDLSESRSLSVSSALQLQLDSAEKPHNVIVPMHEADITNSIDAMRIRYISQHVPNTLAASSGHNAICCCRFSVVKNMCGHGVGDLFHCAPTIPHYSKNKVKHLCSHAVHCQLVVADLCTLACSLCETITMSHIYQCNHSQW